MSKVKEKEVDGKMTLVVNQDEMLNRISAVCAKVEKAQDSYKSIMEDVYLIYKYKLFKESDMDFRTFMHVKTGMGKSTAYRLVKIWKSRIAISDALDDDHVKSDCLAWYDKRSMRELLFICENSLEDEMVNRIKKEVNLDFDNILTDLYVYVADKSIESNKKVEEMLTDKQSDDPGEVLSDEQNAMADEVNDALEKGYQYTWSQAAEVTLSTEVGLSNLTETLHDLILMHGKVTVKYIF